MVTWRKKRSSLDTRAARDKRKKLVRKRAQKKRVADSKRANVRGGESKSTFGLSGAGKNRAALEIAGSAQARTAVNRPLTANEAAFGANPYVPDEPVAVAKQPKFNLDAEMARQNAGNEQTAASNDPNLFGGGEIREQTRFEKLRNYIAGRADFKLLKGLTNSLSPAEGIDDSKQVGGFEGAGRVIGGVGNIITTAGLGGAINRFASFAESSSQRLLTNTAQKMLPAPGSIPTNVGATATADLIPKNTKFYQYIDDAALKWYNNRYAQETLVKSTNLRTGHVTEKLVSTSGKLITPKVLVGSAIALITAGITASLGTAGASLYIRWEALGGLGAALYAAQEAGNFEAVDELTAAQEELMTMTPKDWAATFTPVYGIGYTLDTAGYEAIKKSIKVYRDLSDDGERQRANGQTDDEYFAEKREERLADEEAFRIAALKNAERIQDMKDFAIAEARRANDAQHKAQLEREAAYWEEQRIKNAAWEAEQLRLQQEYWAEYNKRAAEMRGLSTPSKLGFGLI